MFITNSYLQVRKLVRNQSRPEMSLSQRINHVGSALIMFENNTLLFEADPDVKLFIRTHLPDLRHVIDNWTEKDEQLYNMMEVL